ncbi:MAG: ChaN family lipoprotein, partial [Acidobacteria bacterium]|nr:ChaN family lipoprotein [Acidobacteriota bacterium]
MRTALALSVAALVVCSAVARAQDRTLNLEIGDPARKGREAPLRLDGITDTATGAALSPAGLARQLAGVQIVFVGESHTSIEFHNAQRRLIEELSRTGRQVLIGLEMYPSPEQAFLDQWIDGLLTEDGFLTLSRWYRNWGYNWRYYRDIFVFARDHRIRMHAVNAPRDIVTAVRLKGFSGLSPEQAALIPARVDIDHADHRALFKAFMDEGGGMMAGMGAEMFEGMFRAQCTWDATMAYNAVQALQKSGDPNAIMVVLIGSGHVAYGLGAERQAALWFTGRTASVIPTPVADDQGRPQIVRASYANFIWGVPPELAPAYPALGVSIREAGQGTDALPVINVERNS